MGLRLTANRLHFAPCLPADWSEFTLHYRHRATAYHITVRQTPDAETAVSVDGVTQSDPAIQLVDDRRDHQVEVTVRNQK